MYAMNCECDKVCITKTSQRLRQRMIHHRSDIRVKPEASNLTLHINDIIHKLNFKA